ncbi:MAG: hypothetical protein NTW59_01295 [Candidatus Diapherotrites archaeon]|nr:hypothetical protein [Candidatus Diapherotrites archaeon]
MEKSVLLQRFTGFCKNLNSTDRIALIYHGDADGFSSGLIAAKAVESITGKKPVVVCHFEYGDRAQGRKIVSLMRKKKVNKVLIMDIGIDSAPHSMAEKFCFEQCLVIDHHQMCRDLNSEKMVFLKAEFFTDKDPSSYVTSKFAFDLFNEVTDVGGLDWLVCIGIIGDMNLRNWQEFIQKTIEKRNVSLTWLYRFVELIAGVEVMAEDKIEQLFWQFYNAKDPSDVLESGFKKYLEQFREEKEELVRAFDGKAEPFPELELFFYDIKAKHENIKSYVVNEISEMHPNSTVILLQYLGGGRVRFSARRQDFKVRMNDLLVEATKGIPEATAGGHVPAAAGSVPKQFAGQFKKNVIKILGEKYGVQKSRE